MARFTNITQIINGADFTPTQVQALRELASALVDDRDAVYTAIGALDTALDAMAAQLNLDDGVTDDDYAGAATAMPTATGLTGLPG
jgi:hypothetical protein